MRLIWSEQSEVDLFDIADDYGRIDAELADRILNHIETAPLALLDHPRLGQAIDALGLRKWTVRQTPFVLLYRVNMDLIEVARVVHAASDWRQPIA